jgi:hypothetical protein
MTAKLAMERQKPLDVAREEIDAWRGHCINIYSRAEKSISDTLVAANKAEPMKRLAPLAGQRLNDLEKFVSEQTGTKCQKNALSAAVSEWRERDKRRPFFSHGVTTELLDREGVWHVQLDFEAVQKGVCVAQRLNLSKSEALQFQDSLHAAFKALTRELGQLRKRMQP